MPNTKYTRWLDGDSLLQLEGFAKEGLSDEETAERIGISLSTLYDWKKKHKKIADALAAGRTAADTKVESSLFKRAVGYRYDEITVEEKLNPKTGETEKVSTKTVTKEMQPDTSALIFWLKNRKPDIWRDKSEQKHTGGVVIIKGEDEIAE